MSGVPEFWAEMEQRGPESVQVDGVEVGKGSRVLLLPRAGGDVLDLALAGRFAVVESIEHDGEGKAYVAVTLEDDPGRDLGEARMPGHRFFFSLDEIQPVDLTSAPDAPRVLVAGVGNVFFGDDGFGVEVARRLASRPLPPGVDVSDFGIRGMDLAYALHEGYRAVVIVDASSRGEPPGTLSVVEPDPGAGMAAPEAHAMDPVKVLALARQLGDGELPRTLVVACEPGRLPSGDPDADLDDELSPAVLAAVEPAVELVTGLALELVAESDERRGTDDKEVGR